MRWNIQDWVDEVKTKPEHIRRRYVIGCVAASMFFVIIVWSLTVTEGFKKSVAKTEATTNGGILPKPSDFSLDDILSGKDSAETGRPKSGEEFIREQTENRTRLNPDEEGVTPKGEKSAEEDETLPLP